MIGSRIDMQRLTGDAGKGAHPLPLCCRPDIRCVEQKFDRDFSGKPAMTCRSILTAALALLTAAIATPSVADTDLALLMSLAPRVLKVEATNGDGSVSIGSGVVVARGLVATNCHVTQRASSIVLIRGGARSHVESQYSNIDHDLCLLSSPGLESEPVALAPSRAQTGQAVFAVGYVGGIAARVSSGQVDAVYDYDGGKVIETDAWFTSGASGGGLFDEQGRLLGIISFMSRGGQARHYCLPASWVEWAAAHFDGQPIMPLNGLPFWQQPAERQPYFLRAVGLEAAGKWNELADLAREWSFADSGSPSSWYALGTAYARLNRQDQSIAAYEAAVAMEPDFAGAWYGLGLAYAADCHSTQVAHVRTILAGLDSHLADELDRREIINCPGSTGIPSGG
jgi:serine protease Do